MPHEVLNEILINNEWRDGEFAKYKVNAANVDEHLWCRMCVPMIYAHWEGFVVDSFKILLRFLNRLELTAFQLPTNLVVVSLGDCYRSLSGKQSFIQRVGFTERFNDLLSSNVRFPSKIDTKSNLRSSVLNEICDMFNFDCKTFSDFSPDIDRLVNLRNSIAHGENGVVPGIENIKRFIEAVQGAMDVLLSLFDDFLHNENYKLRA
ncbi:MAE_28990/MAE_18760 family HEPN-like nuclease [Pseudomonas viridiflava]